MTMQKISIDNAIVDLSQPQLLDYWTNYFGVTEELLKEVIAIVGNSTKEVEEYINKLINYYMHTYNI
ncbi:MAG: DUF3606 domain-containing protein [Flavipsychrobacter sp.]|nr:DUF3606 domain-containing protein [Flavipsychrobacter sp.]